MALRSFYPIRLMDGYTSGGFQMILPENNMEQLWRVLPDFMLQMEQWQQEDYPAGSTTVELFTSIASKDAEALLRTGLHIRFRMPEDTAAGTIDVLCRKEAGKAAGWLAKRGVICDLPETEEDGTVCLYPQNEHTGFRFFLKERCVEKNNGEVRFFFSPLAVLSAPRILEVLQAVQSAGGRGMSLQLFPDLSAFETQKARALRMLRDPDDFSGQWGAAFTVWGSTEEDAGAFADQISSILWKSGIFVTTKAWHLAGPERMLQLVYDPWALLGWYMDQTGVRLSIQAFSLSARERDGLFQTDSSSSGSVSEEQESVCAGGEISRSIRNVHDDQLNSLADRLEHTLSTEQFLTVASEIMARLETLAGAENELGAKLQRLDAIIEAQEEVTLKRMDALEASVSRCVTQGNQQILSGMRENMEAVLRRIADLPVNPVNAAEIAEALSGMMPAQTSLGLTPEELKAFGVQNEEGLKELGMTDEEIRLLRIALTLARMGLEQTEETDQYMPFAAPLGCFYEMMVYNSFTGNVIERDMENRRREFEQRQAAGFQQERRSPPERKEDTELSFYDYISCQRVEDGYFRHVAMNGKKLPDPIEWNIWFSCFKCVRAIRNKVHSGCGNVSREELENLYRLMVFPGSKYKKNSILYLINHPSQNTRGNADPSLLIRYYNGRKKPVNALLQYINQHSADCFQESLIQFLLDFRKNAEWLDGE